MSNKRKAGEADAPSVDKKTKTDTVVAQKATTSSSETAIVESPVLLERFRRTFVEDRKSDANWVYTPNQIRDAVRVLYECLTVASLLEIVASYGDPGLDLVRQMFGGWNLGRVLGVHLRINDITVATEKDFSLFAAEEGPNCNVFTLSIRDPETIHKADVLRVYGGDPTTALERLTEDLPALPIYHPIPTGTRFLALFDHAALRRGTVPDNDHTELSMFNWLSTDSSTQQGFYVSTRSLADVLLCMINRLADSSGNIWYNLYRFGSTQAPCF